MRIDFTVPGKPVGKARPRATIRAGRAAVYTPAKTARYENIIALTCQEAMVHKDLAMFERPVVVSISVSFRPPASWSKAKQLRSIGMPYDHKPDIDNLVKSVLDGLNGVAFPDDKSVYELHVAKQYATADEVAVRIEEWE